MEGLATITLYLFTSHLLWTKTSAAHLPTSELQASWIPKESEGQAFPYGYWQIEKDKTSTPTTTLDSSTYEYFYKENGDLGTDPSTWKLLPIQIPDDLVSGASIEKEFDVSSVVPPYPTLVTPQFAQQQETKKLVAKPYNDGPYEVTASSQGDLDSQHLTWTRADTQSTHKAQVQQPIYQQPEQQNHLLEHEPDGNHKSQETLYENLDHHDKTLLPGRPEPEKQDHWGHQEEVSNEKPEFHQETLDYHHATDVRQINAPELQYPTWESQIIEQSSKNPPAVHHSTLDNHYYESDQRDSEVQHQQVNQYEGNEMMYGTPEQEYSWDRYDTNNYYSFEKVMNNQHSTKHHMQHSSPPPEHYYNWTHTLDGYNIKNNHEDYQFPQESYASNQNSEQSHHQMPNRPAAFNWKPFDSTPWHENIVQRIGQHIPKLPSLPTIKFPGLGSFPSLPKWIIGGDNRRVYNNAVQEVEGDYIHKFYNLIPQNNPLKHLQDDRDRQYGPHYRYPPRQDHSMQSTPDYIHHTDKISQDHGLYSTSYGGDSSMSTYSHYTTQQPTKHYHQGTHSNRQNDVRKGSHLRQSGLQAVTKFPQYKQHTQHSLNNKVGPQRVLKVPHRQEYEGYLEKHHKQPDEQHWTWEIHDEETTPQSYPPQRDPLNRYPSPLHDWPQRKPAHPSTGYPSRNTTRYDQLYYPQTYTAHTKMPHRPVQNQRYPQYQQVHQHEGSSSWFSTEQQQNEDPDFYDNILGPLSSLLSRPSPLQIIGSSPYQQSIMDRLTGVDSSDTAPSLAIPGGLLVLGLALALFYFNFVWYPTPVVTAKIFKMLSDTRPDGSLSVGQQRAIGEVYQVFRSLEKEYKHDPSTASSSQCRSRLVCQVHRELPGLWSVTQGYAALVISSLVASEAKRGGEEHSEYSSYQEAARLGAEGKEDCQQHYKSCTLPPIPVKEILRELLTNLLRND